MNISFKKLLLILLILILIYISETSFPAPRSSIRGFGRNVYERYPEFDKLNQFTKLDENPPFINDWEFTINSNTILYFPGITLYKKWTIVQDPKNDNQLLFNYNAKLSSLSLSINDNKKNDFISSNLSEQDKNTNFIYNDNNVYNIKYVDDPLIKKIRSSTDSVTNMRYYDNPIKINNWFIDVDSNNNLIFNYLNSSKSLAIDTQYNIIYNIESKSSYINPIIPPNNELVIGNFKFNSIVRGKEILRIVNKNNVSVPIYFSNNSYYFGPLNSYYIQSSSTESNTNFIEYGDYTNIDKNVCSAICDITQDCYSYNYYDSTKRCRLIKNFNKFENYVDNNYKTYFNKSYLNNPNTWVFIRSEVDKIFGWKDFIAMKEVAVNGNNESTDKRLIGYIVGKNLCGKNYPGFSPCTSNEDAFNANWLGRGIYQSGGITNFDEWAQTNDSAKIILDTQGLVYFNFGNNNTFGLLPNLPSYTIFRITTNAVETVVQKAINIAYSFGPQYSGVINGTNKTWFDPMAIAVSNKYKLYYIWTFIRESWVEMPISNIKFVCVDGFDNVPGYRPMLFIKGPENVSEENDVYYCKNLYDIVNGNILTSKKLSIKFKQASIAKGVIVGITPSEECYIGTIINYDSMEINWMKIFINNTVTIKWVWNTGDYLVATDKNNFAYYSQINPFILKTFIRISETDIKGGGGGTAYDLVCPPGSYVTNFYGKSGSVVDRIGIKCSDGRDIGSYGGGGGSDFSSTSSNGFDRLSVRTGGVVDQVQFWNKNINYGIRGGWGGTFYDLKCDKGKIMGLKLRSGSVVDAIGVVCGDEITKPAVEYQNPSNLSQWLTNQEVELVLSGNVMPMTNPDSGDLMRAGA
jgi:hypothetical protein